MESNWFLGFCEAEGNFVITFSTKVYKDRHYVWARPGFQTKQTDDMHVLEEIKEFLTEHKIKSHLHPNSQKQYGNLKKIPLHPLEPAILQVFETDSLKRLVELIEPLHWFSKKRSDFEKWVQCINILSSKNKSKYMIAELRQIAKILPDMNGWQNTRIWTPERLELHLKTYKPYKDILKTALEN